MRNYLSILGLHLTHWGRVTHLCVSKLTSIASDNGLSPGRRQAIIWTNAEILLIGPLGTNFNEILIEIHRVHYDVTVMLLSTSPGKTMNLYWKGYLIVCETVENRTPPLLLALLLIMWYRVLPICYFINILSNIGSKCYVSYQWNLLFTIVSLKYLDGSKSNAFVSKIIVPWLWTLLHIPMILCWVGSEQVRLSSYNYGYANCTIP